VIKWIIRCDDIYLLTLSGPLNKFPTWTHNIKSATRYFYVEQAAEDCVHLFNSGEDVVLVPVED